MSIWSMEVKSIDTRRLWVIRIGCGLLVSAGEGAGRSGVSPFRTGRLRPRSVARRMWVWARLVSYTHLTLPTNREV